MAARYQGHWAAAQQKKMKLKDFRPEALKNLEFKLFLHSIMEQMVKQMLEIILFWSEKLESPCNLTLVIIHMYK